MDSEGSDIDDSYLDDDYNHADDMDNDDCDFLDDDAVFSDEDIDTDDKKTYTILQVSEIIKRQEELISSVVSTLFVTNAIASKLLYHYKWNISSLLEEWFADEVRTRAKVGLSNTNPIFFDNQEKTETLCEICYEWFPRDDFHFYSLNCGHLYCVSCWKDYITISINDGPGCLSLTCPAPRCGDSVCRDIVDKLVGPTEKEKYDRFVIRSFIEGNKKAKWCPAPGCDNAVEFELDSDLYDVKCLCSHEFCWNCVEETHRPVDCRTVSNWIEKNSSESENTTWILANSKPCPKCNRAIEKNHGCMHMTCTAPCNFEFCWLCLGDWTKHGENTGGFFSCNKYEKQKDKGEFDEDISRRKLARSHLQKYTHFYERWDGNHKSRLKAIQDLEEMKIEKVPELSRRLNKPETELEFIFEALEKIIECRRVLKWTYAYGYYLPNDQPQKKAIFEYLQGEAEANLERLHKCAEKELLSFLEDEYMTPDEPNNKTLLTDQVMVENPSTTETLTDQDKVENTKTTEMVTDQENVENTKTTEAVTDQEMENTTTVTDQEKVKIAEAERKKNFLCYQEKLAHLTRVTRFHFEKLVRDLEKGLSEFEVESTEGHAMSSDLSMFDDDDDDLDASDYWTCNICTYSANPNASVTCRMCQFD